MWLANWGMQPIISADPHGKAEVMAFSIDWLLSGRPLVVLPEKPDC